MGFFSALLGAPEVVTAVAETVKSGMGMLDNAFIPSKNRPPMQIK